MVIYYPKRAFKALCKTRIHCAACRTSEELRQKWVDLGMIDRRDFECPFGVTAETANEARYDQALWPFYWRTAAKMAQPGDKGIGDVVARLVGPIGGDAYKVWFEKLTGKKCGCAERQESLNLNFPFKPKSA